jgi:RNA polymerase sigma-70 factor (ECF subfamily)
MLAADDPDNDLIQRFRQGDRSAFNQLVLKYRNRVMGLATRMVGDRVEGEDLCQDIFVKVFQGLKSFEGGALFSTWLYRITANSCLNHKRRRGARSSGYAPEGLEANLTSAHNPDALLEKKQLRAVLEKAIGELPPEQRVVLILRDVEEQSYEAIASSLSIELGTVRSRLHRARAQLQARLRQTLFGTGEEGIKNEM